MGLNQVIQNYQQTPSIDPVILFKVKFSEPNAARTRNVVIGVNEFNMEDNPTVIFVCAKNIKVKGITLFSIPFLCIGNQPLTVFGRKIIQKKRS